MEGGMEGEREASMGDVMRQRERERVRRLRDASRALGRPNLLNRPGA